VAQSPALHAVTTTLALTPALVNDGQGNFYYTLNGEVQASPGRPTQPRGSVVITPGLRDVSLRGALLLSARYTDIANFNPLVVVPVTDTATAQPEPPFAAEGWFPVKFWAANRFGDQDRLTVVAGQFNQNGSVERLYDRMQVQTFYVDDLSVEAGDLLPPTIWEAQVESSSNGGLVFTVNVEDFDTGLSRVLVTVNLPDGRGGGSWRSFDLAPAAAGSAWSGSLQLPGLDVLSIEYFVQALDQAGNVALSGNKGQFHSGIASTLYLPLVMRNAQR